MHYPTVASVASVHTHKGNDDVGDREMVPIVPGNKEQQSSNLIDSVDIVNISTKADRDSLFNPKIDNNHGHIAYSENSGNTNPGGRDENSDIEMAESIPTNPKNDELDCSSTIDVANMVDITTDANRSKEIEFNGSAVVISDGIFLYYSCLLIKARSIHNLSNHNSYHLINRCHCCNSR